MDLQTILFIVSGVLTVLSAVLGTKYTNVKKAVKETKDVVVAIVDVWEDDKIDKEETDRFVKEIKESIAAWGLVFKKKE